MLPNAPEPEDTGALLAALAHGDDEAPMVEGPPKADAAGAGAPKAELLAEAGAPKGEALLAGAPNALVVVGVLPKGDCLATVGTGAGLAAGSEAPFELTRPS